MVGMFLIGLFVGLVVWSGVAYFVLAGREADDFQRDLAAMRRIHVSGPGDPIHDWQGKGEL